MLCDRPRQEAYRDAILKNRNLFEGKTVLDVGAGSGILSIFCALAGARKVHAVEASAIVPLTRKIVSENNFDNVIEVHRCKIEEFELRNEDGTVASDQRQIDIIVSEWMGFYLLHEGMLDSVIEARNKFLRAGGYMFPQTASISIAPCELPSLFDSWTNVDGVKMQEFGKALRAQKSHKPEVMNVAEADLLHHGTIVAWLDLNEVSIEELNSFEFNEVFVSHRPGRYQGVCIWFDVEFPAGEHDDAVTLSTSPATTPTHWKQTVIPLPDEVLEDVETRYPIAIKIDLRRTDENRRHYNLEMTMVDADDVEHSVPCDCILTKCILIKEHLNLNE